jgi:hypothetical protein
MGRTASDTTRAEHRRTEPGFDWLFFLTSMQQHQVDSLRFGVNPYDDVEWASFVQWYRLYCKRPGYKHNRGTVFPLSPDELRDQLKKH